MTECSEISKSIKELSNKIDQYKSQVETRLNSVESKVESLERRFQGFDQSIKQIILIVNQHQQKIQSIENSLVVIRTLNTFNQKHKINRDFQYLKQRIIAIEGYINALDNAGKSINNILTSFTRLFRKKTF